MSTPNPQKSQPSLAALTARFIDYRSLDAVSTTDTCSPVELHEAASGFRTDTRTAWSEALAAVRAVSGGSVTLPPPAAWAGVVRQLQPRFAIPLCVGNYPQMLGETGQLYAASDLTALAHGVPGPGNRTEAVSLQPADRSRKTGPEMAVLLMAAGQRLAGDYASADATLRTAGTPTDGPWAAATVNELAAVSWEAGRADEAIALWESLPDGAVKSFNLGMAELFTGRPDAAVAHLDAAAKALPEATGWNHLARLYLALTEKESS